MERATCVMCGVEFPLPIQPEEIPPLPGRRGNMKEYWVQGKNSMHHDNTRAFTIRDCENNQGQWTEAGHDAQTRAIEKVKRALKKSGRKADINAILQRAVDNAKCPDRPAN